MSVLFVVAELDAGVPCTCFPRRRNKLVLHSEHDPSAKDSKKYSIFCFWVYASRGSVAGVLETHAASFMSEVSSVPQKSCICRFGSNRPTGKAMAGAWSGTIRTVNWEM